MGRREADYAAARAHADTLRRLDGSAESLTMRWHEPQVLAAVSGVRAWLIEMTDNAETLPYPFPPHPTIGQLAGVLLGVLKEGR